MKPVVPATACDDVVKISVRVDDTGESTHGPTHVKLAGASDPAVDEGEASILVGGVPVVSCY